MSLESLRRKVAFQNSIDVWIAAAEDAGADWRDPEGYKRFVSYLRGRGLGLRAFTLCAHDAGAEEKEKADLAEKLAGERDADPNAATYTVRLTDEAMGVIRGFSP